jgi:hypothetical protein
MNLPSSRVPSAEEHHAVLFDQLVDEIVSTLASLSDIRRLQRALDSLRAGAHLNREHNVPHPTTTSEMVVRMKIRIDVRAALEKSAKMREGRQGKKSRGCRAQEMWLSTLMICAVGFVGDTKVTMNPMSIATFRPRKST